MPYLITNIADGPREIVPFKATSTEEREDSGSNLECIRTIFRPLSENAWRRVCGPKSVCAEEAPLFGNYVSLSRSRSTSSPMGVPAALCKVISGEEVFVFLHLCFFFVATLLQSLFSLHPPSVSKTVVNGERDNVYRAIIKGVGAPVCCCLCLHPINLCAFHSISRTRPVTIL